jgi:uncharacterized protein (TIGR02646 family)
LSCAPLQCSGFKVIKIERSEAPARLDPATALALTTEYAVSASNVWNKTFIREALLAMSKDKCAYCECTVAEESKYMEVEHFLPKSVYPAMVVEWTNLLPACKRCNGSKRDYDAHAEGMIIDPSSRNPKDHLYFKDHVLRYKDDIGRRTIEVCNLNETDRLYLVRARLAAEACHSLERTKELLEDYIAGARETRRRNQIVRSIEQLLRQSAPAQQYSALLATALLTDPTYKWIRDRLQELDEWAPLASLESAAATVALPPP